MITIKNPQTLEDWIGLSLADARSAAGLTQAAVAEAMGTAVSTVSRFEKGRTMTLPHFLEFCQAVGIKRPGQWLGRRLREWEDQGGKWGNEVEG